MDKTYKQICNEIAEYLKQGTQGKVNLTGDQIFELHPHGDLLPVHMLYDYMTEKCDPVDVLLFDTYIGKLVLGKMNESNSKRQD